MNIVHYSHCNLGTSEASTAHVMEFAERLGARGHSVTVLAPAKGRYAHPTACDMRYFRYVNVKGLRQVTAIVSGFLLLVRLHAAKHFDCLYIRNLGFDLLPALFSRLTGVPLVVETNGQAEIFEFEVPLHFLWTIFWLPALKAVERTLFGTAYAVTADGAGRLDHFKRSYPSLEKKFSMVRAGGIDLQKFRPVDREQARSDCGLPPRVPVLVWVGTMFAWSGLDILFSAARSIVDAHPDVHFLVIGGGPERDRFTASARGLGLEGAVTFTGYVATRDLYTWLSASTAAVAPYTRLRLDREDFTSYKIFEYLACGLPVVCSYEKGDSNIAYVSRFGLGETVPPEDPEAFAQAVVRVLKNPDFFTDAFVTRCRETLTSLEVTWESLVDKVERLCSDAATDANRRSGKHSRNEPGNSE